MAQNYLTKGKMAIEQSNEIRKEAEKNKLEIKIDVDRISEYILSDVENKEEVKEEKDKRSPEQRFRMMVQKAKER